MRVIAVAGPVLLALLTALYVGRPSPYFLLTGIALAVAIFASDGWIIARRHWITAGMALASQTLLLIFVDTSVVVFVTLPGAARYAFVGDLVWQLEGLLEREERPWFEARTLAENPALLR